MHAKTRSGVSFIIASCADKGGAAARGAGIILFGAEIAREDGGELGAGGDLRGIFIE